jgi:uncharacterized protein YidB (DUF937 family)
MGLLDSVIGALGQRAPGAAGGGQADMLSVIVGMLGNDAQGGGLASLVQRFQQAGLGDVVASWISTGQNQPVGAGQLEDVLGSDTVASIARQLGLSQGDAAGQLSELLPQVVDRLTPQGQLPQGGLGNVGDLLGALLRR